MGVRTDTKYMFCAIIYMKVILVVTPLLEPGPSASIDGDIDILLHQFFSIIYNSIAEKSIIHRGPRIWSNIPQPIKECETKNSFNKILKRHFLTNQEHLS